MKTWTKKYENILGRKGKTVSKYLGEKKKVIFERKEYCPSNGVSSFRRKSNGRDHFDTK